MLVFMIYRNSDNKCAELKADKFVVICYEAIKNTMLCSYLIANNYLSIEYMNEIPSVYLSHLRPVFFIDRLSGWSVHWWKWVVKVCYCYYVTVNLSFYGCWHLPYILRWFYVGCLYIYNCYIFLDWTFHHHVVSVFVFISL